jgi:Zinc carboxypeptidase
MSKRIFVLIVSCLSLTAALGDESSVAVSDLGIPIEPDKAGFVIVKKVRVTDSRAVSGFLATPVDGSVKSWDYRGRTHEYPKKASDGVVYSFNNNDGLHVILSDAKGFDVVVLRGGARTKMYSGTDALTEPAAEKPLYEFDGTRQNATALFGSRIKTDAVTFFDVADGTISDVAFYRLGKEQHDMGNAESWTCGSGSVELRKPQSPFAPGSLYLAMNELYGQGEHRCIPLLRADTSADSSLQCEANQAVHFITPAFDKERGLSAVALEMNVAGPKGPFSFTVAVQDPLDPRLDLAWLQFRAGGAGRFALKLDVPNQVLFKGSQLWLTLRFDKDVRLSGPSGGAPAFGLFFVPTKQALPEALARRKLLMRSFFSLLSEPRPWGSYRKQSREQFYTSSRYAGQCPELFMTIDECYKLAPADDTVRQYREWVYFHNIDELAQVSPPPKPPEAIPAWAWYPRLAWLEVRRIAEWWLDERLVPSGEFGGRVGDDSDFYQQFADLPFFETGGVAAKLMENAARMAELADRENLRDGLNIHATDSLHAYEEGINHLALMARWFYGDPIYFERCMESARNMEKLTILTPDGRRHFRDRERMGVEDLERPRKPNIDGGADALMWHTALQVAAYNRNPRALKILCEWADTWLKFMRPGQWATDVEVLSGKVIGFQRDRPLYGGYRTQATTFTWLYGLTGRLRYLEPFLYYYRQGKAPMPADGFLADVYCLGGLGELSQQTINRLAAYNPALALYLHGDPKPLIQATIGDPRGSGQYIATLYDARRWPDMYTMSQQFTDRIFPSLLEHASLAYLGGFCRRNKFNPTLAVSWEGLGTDYAALVLDNQPRHLKVLVYSFAEKPLKGKMRVWALEHGQYQLTAGPDADGDHRMDRIERSESLELTRGDRIELTLAPRAVTVFEIKQTGALDPIFGRADLAIAAREVAVKANIITGVVHNIGSADVPDVVVAVVDATGRKLTSKSLGRLAAPTDLVPRKIPFTLELPGPPGPGCKLVLDPDQHVPEIYEGNNAVPIDPPPAIGTEPKPLAGMTYESAKQRIPKRKLPEFWVGDMDRLKQRLSDLKNAEVRTIAHSPGGRPIQLIAFGQREHVSHQANFNSAIGGHDPAAYMDRKARTKPVVLFVGPVHGAEVEGLTGLINLAAVMDTGRDLAGRDQSELRSLGRQCRLLIIPMGNPDGVARFEPHALFGMTEDDLRFWGQGTWSDNTFCGWPECKRRHPMTGDDIGFLGCYFDDKGVNPMHDEFFAPMGPESPAILKVAKDEGPDLAVSLHGHEAAPALLRPAYVTEEVQKDVRSLAEECYALLEKRGLPHQKPFSIAPEGGKNPAPFNLTSALYHVSGATSFTFECPHGLTDRSACHVSAGQILDIQLTLYEAMLRHEIEKKRAGTL